jgi:predicted PurR-regulated permease PerM
MSLPPPSERQARLFWSALAVLAIGIILATVGLVAWGGFLVVQRLSSVLLPLAIAGILAYLLDPVVDYLENHRIPRTRAILMVFFMAIMLFLLLLSTVAPRLVVETGQLIDQIPAYAKQARQELEKWLSDSTWGIKAQVAWSSQMAESAQGWLTQAAPGVTAWIWENLGKAMSWAGFLAGIALVPVYTFYFLLEKAGIQNRWTDYLPLRESMIKEEIVFVLRAINDYLIVFFRGQVLVALCDGILLTLGFLILGLNYAVLLGFIAGALSIVPYLGVMLSLLPALALAAIQFGDWMHPILVLVIFALVQTLEGLVISPKIIGDRVGLHPLTIIIAVMVGTTLLGGILGGVLAIPLTAALRVIMFRYVWRQR